MRAKYAISMALPEAEAPANQAPLPAEVRPAAVAQADIDLIAACLIGEAGGEGRQGMQAVMNVIFNRAGGQPGQMRGVVLRRAQFSMFNAATGSNPSRTVEQIVTRSSQHPLFAQASLIARQAMTNGLPDISGGATHYHNQTVNPSWNRAMRRTSQIGNHTFYR